MPKLLNGRRTEAEIKAVQDKVVDLYVNWPGVRKSNHAEIVVKAIHEVLDEDRRFNPYQLASNPKLLKRTIHKILSDPARKSDKLVRKSDSASLLSAESLEKMIYEGFEKGIPIVLKQYTEEIFSPIKDKVNLLLQQIGQELNDVLHVVKTKNTSPRFVKEEVKPVNVKKEIPVGNPADLFRVRTSVETINSCTPILADDVAIGLYGFNLNTAKEFVTRIAKRIKTGLVIRFYEKEVPCVNLHKIFVYGTNSIEEELSNKLNKAGYPPYMVIPIAKCNGSWERLETEIMNVYVTENRKRESE
jgi:hypothetical protein